MNIMRQKCLYFYIDNDYDSCFYIRYGINSSTESYRFLADGTCNVEGNIHVGGNWASLARATGTYCNESRDNHVRG